MHPSAHLPFEPLTIVALLGMAVCFGCGIALGFYCGLDHAWRITHQRLTAPLPGSKR